MNKYNDDFIANAIIQSDYLINEEYKNIIEELHNKNHYIDPPTSDLDPYYIIRSHDNKIKLKASYIGDIITENNDSFYLKWSWSRAELSKASKVNLLKILKYFLDQEPADQSSMFMQINNAFIQSIIKVDYLFYEILINALLHLMKHKFEIKFKTNNLIKIYLIKEIIVL